MARGSPLSPPDHDYSAYHPYEFWIRGAIDYTTTREYEVVSYLRESTRHRLRDAGLTDTVTVVLCHLNGHGDAVYDWFYTDTATTGPQHFTMIPTARGDSVDISARFQMLRQYAERPAPGTAWDLPARFELVVGPVRVAVPPPRAPE